MGEKVYSKFWIYRITNNINGKFYIGQTCDITKRRSAHKLAKDESTYVSRSILKYGWINHSMEAVFYSENVNVRLADQIEIYFIRYFNSYHIDNEKGMNLNMGGISGIQTVEQIEKMVRTKFFTWKSKMGKDGKGIEILDKKTGSKIVTHYGEPNELFKLLGIKSENRLMTRLTNNLKREKGLFCKKYIVQWEGEDKFANYKARKAAEIETLRNAPMTSKRLQSLNGYINSAKKRQVPVINIQNGVFFDSISDFAINESVSIASVLKRFDKGVYKNKYKILRQNAGTV